MKISAICSEVNVDGLRGDIASNRTAKALASFEGRDEVAVEDIYRCARPWKVLAMYFGEQPDTENTDNSSAVHGLLRKS